MKTYVYLAEGFEEIEAITVIDVLRRAEIETVTVSITDEKEVKGAGAAPVDVKQFGKEYVQFRQSLMPQFTRYEKWAQSLGNVIKLKPSKKVHEKEVVYLIHLFQIVVILIGFLFVL